MTFLNKDRWSYKTGVLRQTYAKRILHLRNVYININVDIKFSAHQRFWNNLHQVRTKSKDWKVKDFFKYHFLSQIPMFVVTVVLLLLCL